MQKAKLTKRFISFIMAFVLVIMLIPAGITTVGAAGDESKFLAPIEAPIAGSIPISTAAQLAAIGNDSDSLSKNYHLANDIDLSGSEWLPIGTSSLPFTGTFDGQGYVIKNLTITGDHRYAGLFGYTTEAMIKNVGLEGTNIDISSTSSDVYAGGICCESIGSNSSISNCYNTGDVSAATTSSSYSVVVPCGGK
ncbi:MAG: hypothetical protein FWH48_08960 [Oscillospiraceae bacterium]|nr:hypothetical protein [Oscillospiraceae bacterium]